MLWQLTHEMSDCGFNSQPRNYRYYSTILGTYISPPWYPRGAEARSFYMADAIPDTQPTVSKQSVCSPAGNQIKWCYIPIHSCFDTSCSRINKQTNETTNLPTNTTWVKHNSLPSKHFYMIVNAVTLHAACCISGAIISTKQMLQTL